MIFRAYALENPGVWGRPQVHTARRPRAQTGIQKLHFLNRHLPLTNTARSPFPKPKGEGDRSIVDCVATIGDDSTIWTVSQILIRVNLMAVRTAT